MSEVIIDFKAVRNGYPKQSFDGASAFTQADEQELVFLEPPQEYKDIVGPNVHGVAVGEDAIRAKICSERLAGTFRGCFDVRGM